MSDYMSTPTRSVDELKLWVSDWSRDLVAALKLIPVHFVHSEYHDWLSTEMLKSHADRYVGAKCHIMRGIAQLFLFERPDLYAESARLIFDDFREF